MPNVSEISKEISDNTMAAIGGVLNQLGNTMKLTVDFNNVPQEAIDAMKELAEYLKGAQPLVEKVAFEQAKAIKAADRQILTVKTGIIH